MPRKGPSAPILGTNAGGPLGQDGVAPKTAKKAGFRLTRPPAPTEAALQAQIVAYLRHQQTLGRVVWFCRVNGGLAQYGPRVVKNYLLHLAGAAPTGKGYADLHGMLAGGRYFALEVKKPGEKATPEQQIFLAAVESGGGIARVVTGFAEVEHALFATAG